MRGFYYCFVAKVRQISGYAETGCVMTRINASFIIYSGLDSRAGALWSEKKLNGRYQHQ
jgi:hypothetical protein